MLLFYKHQFSVLKFKNSNDCPALDDTNKRTKKMNVLPWLFFGVKKRMGLVLRGSYYVGTEMTVDHIGAFWHRPLSVPLILSSVPGSLLFPPDSLGNLSPS